MTRPTLLIATLSGCVAVGALLMAVQSPAQSPDDLAALSPAEKLEILNSGDEAAIRELMEAEEAALRAKQAAKSAEIALAREQNAIKRAEAQERGAAYWAAFDVAEIDLTGLDYAMVTEMRSADRDAAFAALPVSTGFERASAVTYPRDNFDCEADRYSRIKDFLEIAPDIPMPADNNDMARMLDYLGDRAALSSGDCSCATQAVPIEKGWNLLERVARVPGGDQIKGSTAKNRELGILSGTFRAGLKYEARDFCEQG